MQEINWMRETCKSSIKTQTALNVSLKSISNSSPTPIISKNKTLFSYLFNKIGKL